MGVIRFSPAGWHGRFDEEFNEDNVVRLVGALGAAWASKRAGGRVYVGYDRRYRAEAFALLAGKVLATFGLEPVVSLGACPLPALSWQVARDEEAVGAVMLTASEAPCEYDGIIARGADGGPVSAFFAREVGRRVLADPIRPTGDVRRIDFVTPYIDHLAQQVDLEAIGSICAPIVIDPMYGAASGLLAGLLRDAGCTVVELHGEGRVDFGGIHPEPVEPWVDECEQEVVRQQACVGLALDGDGDRASLIDERGRLVAAHNLAPLVLAHLVEDKGASGRVVTTLASSCRVRRQARRLGLEVTTVPVGFDRIYGELLQGDVLLACEAYGGICVASHLLERDGLLASLLILEALAQGKMTISEMVADMLSKIGNSEYARRDVRLDAASAQALDNLLPGINPVEMAGKKPVAVSHSDGLHLLFDDDSWALLRPSRSGTTVRTYAEASTTKERDRLLAELASLARDPQMWKNYGEQ